MPNIVITEYCNLKCPYCFAQTMINTAKKDTKNISDDQLNKILNWLSLSSISNDSFIGLIGGEPTLHPNFKNILKKINTFNTLTNSKSIIFTNGLTLNEFLTDIGLNTSILVNVNNLSKDLKDKLLFNLNLIEQLGWFEIQKVNLGCNLYPEENDYSFFWDIVDKFSISQVRMSVTSPSSKDYLNDKFTYYTKMKNIAFNFIEEAYKRHIKITYDCNQIPLCFFNIEEKKIIQSLGNYPQGCEPTIDITPDFKATCCFGAYNPIDCNLFSNLEELKKYFQAQIFKKISFNTQGKCKTCNKLEFLQCQGGCLTFTQGKID